MKPVTLRLALLACLPVFMAGCTSQYNDLRAKRFANTPMPTVQVNPSALSVSLNTVNQGKGLSAESLENLNTMLGNQGRLKNQSLTLQPFTPAGEQMAKRLARVLSERGADADRIIVAPIQLKAAEQSGGWDLQVISEAIVAQIPDCQIANPKAWTMTPYQAVGTLGCANRANIARMVSDPRDLVRPRTLDSADGNQANNAVQRYQENKVIELMNIDFAKDD
ncbi:CpaD family pilus assembly lipoprotein [Pseudomonas sp. NPDC089734]|uniref:CpaD family pilus assembly lipoprotein n=1 Tax=Pseudomonas sp. NPDC089734 TaxID=3364469 RepID=UPI0037F435DE